MPSVLDDTLKKHRRRLIEREEAAFRELLEAYSVIERDLKRQFQELQKQILDAKAAGENISPSWLFRERRLKTLIDQVKQQIVRFGETATRITEREQRAAIRIAAEQTGEMFRVQSSGLGVQGLGSTLPTRAVEDAVGMMGDGSPILEYYRENLAPKVAEAIRTEVIKAVAMGTDFRTVANRLLQTGQITRSRALMVARTEVNRVRRETTRQIYLENSDVITGWEWVASSSPRTCPACLAMDGRIFKLKDAFPQHPNCLISGTVVSSSGTQAASKRWYEGQVVEISTSRGFSLTVTPNHPIMTREGWIQANLLNESGNVISTRDAERMSANINPDKDNVPTVVDQIFSSSGERSGVPSVIVPPSAKNFHGDGEGGDVDIVFTNGLLQDDFDASFFEPASKNLFVNRDMAFSSLTGLGTFDQFGIRSLLSANGIMGRFGVPGVFGIGPFCHHQAIGSSRAANLNTIFDQTQPNYRPESFERLSQRIFGLASNVTSANLIDNQINASGFQNAAFFENAVERIPPDVKFCTNFINAHSADVGVDRIVKIRRYFFRGHVYNLETSTGYYVANNIITHNCRCQMIPVIDGVDRPQRILGGEWLEQQPDDVKAQVLGKLGAEAYNRSDVTLKDFIGWQNDKQFGRSVYTRSLGDALKSSVKNFADRVEQTLQKAGFSTRRVASKTGSQYLVVERGGKRVKVRIADHGPSVLSKGNRLDIRPGTDMSDDELIGRLDEELP